MTEFQDLAAPHAQFHSIVAEALRDKSRGRDQAVRLKMNEAKRLSQSVVAKMEKLLERLV